MDGPELTFTSLIMSLFFGISKIFLFINAGALFYIYDTTLNLSEVWGLIQLTNDVYNVYN